MDFCAVGAGETAAGEGLPDGVVGEAGKVVDEAGYVGEVVVFAALADAGPAKDLVENFGRDFLGAGAVGVVRDNRARGVVCAGWFRGRSGLCRAFQFDSILQQGFFGLD